MNNHDFYAAVVEYRELKKTNPEAVPSAYIGECIMHMAQRISKKLNFSSYTWRDEMIGDAIENGVRALAAFDPAKSTNIFGYMTSCIHNAFVRRIHKEKKQLATKIKLTQEHFIFENVVDEESGEQKSVYENNNEFLQKYEESQRRRKDRKAAGARFRRSKRK